MVTKVPWEDDLRLSRAATNLYENNLKSIKINAFVLKENQKKHAHWDGVDQLFPFGKPMVLSRFLGELRGR